MKSFLLSDKPVLFVSFSGGRTSGYMCKWLIDNMSHEYTLIFVFMNTGQEHEETLKFVKMCDIEFGLNLIWIEAVTQHGVLKGSTYRIVNFDNASRHAEPFEEMIIKYGIPNKSWPHCNRELKLNPFKQLKRDLGLRKSLTAVGIRSDEIDRMSVKADKEFVMYPLIKWHPTTKEDVLNWWKTQSFDLNIPEHLGNCVTCWKKSKRKLQTIALQEPERFWFNSMCESKYKYNGYGDEPRVFFRENRSTNDIFRESRDDFTPFTDPNYVYSADMDSSNGCSESCDVFTED